MGNKVAVKPVPSGYRRLPQALTLVEWVDSSRLSNAWMDMEDIPEPQPHLCVSVGFVVGDNEKGVILVPTVADVDHPENQHTYGGMLIPRSAIVSMNTLTCAV